MRRYEIYVIDPVRASIWYQTQVTAGQVISTVDDECETANCQHCGTLHGVAAPSMLEKNGLAARRA